MLNASQEVRRELQVPLCEGWRRVQRAAPLLSPTCFGLSTVPLPRPALPSRGLLKIDFETRVSALLFKLFKMHEKKNTVRRESARM